MATNHLEAAAPSLPSKTHFISMANVNLMYSSACKSMFRPGLLTEVQDLMCGIMFSTKRSPNNLFRMGIDFARMHSPNDFLCYGFHQTFDLDSTNAPLDVQNIHRRSHFSDQRKRTHMRMPFRKKRESSHFGPKSSNFRVLEARQAQKTIRGQKLLREVVPCERAFFVFFDRQHCEQLAYSRFFFFWVSLLCSYPSLAGV